MKMNTIIFLYINDERVVRLNRKLTAGVITGLLLAPTAIANAQENDAQSRVTTHTEQVAYMNEVAAATTREQLIAQFGKLSENSSADDMVIAKGDLQVLVQQVLMNTKLHLLKRSIAMWRSSVAY